VSNTAPAGNSHPAVRPVAGLSWFSPSRTQRRIMGTGHPPGSNGYRMTYVGRRFEQLALGQGPPTVQMRDRWNTSVAGHVAEPPDPVTTLMFCELEQATHSMQRALVALDEFSHIAAPSVDPSHSSELPRRL
jgi:hypothetical protein